MRKLAVVPAIVLAALVTPAVVPGTATAAAPCGMYEKTKDTWHFKNCTKHNQKVVVHEGGQGVKEGCFGPGVDRFIMWLSNKPKHTVDKKPCKF